MNVSEHSRNKSLTDSSAADLSQPLIEVLLATYNGEKFLDEQLDSLFAQTWKNIRILVNDDGSSDDTQKILYRYAARYPGYLWIEHNLQQKGPCGNFDALMKRSTAKYVAFCDQDDVWCETKLAHCMDVLKTIEMKYGSSLPVLVYTDLKLSSSDGSIHSQSHWERSRVRPEKACFRNLLAQNLVTGCTMIANRSLIDLALPIPVAEVIMHDYWLALIASAFGILEPIHKKTVTYRQHADNVVGAAGGLSWTERLSRIQHDGELEKWLAAAAAQSAAFLDRFGATLPQKSKLALISMTHLPASSWLHRNLSLLRHKIKRTGTLNHLQFLLRL
jgi:hypothetical protein